MTVLWCADEYGGLFGVQPGASCAGFREKQCYEFAIPEVGMQLFVDDHALETAGGRSGTAWRWEPGFYAGEVLAELVDAGGSVVAHYRFDVGPDSHKLGNDYFFRMVDEIFDFDPRLILGNEPAQFRVGSAGAVSNPHLEYARLRRYVPAFLRALSAVGEYPITRLQRQRVLVRPHEVRQLDRGSLRQLVRNPAALTLMRGFASDARVERAARFDVARCQDESDNPANRTLQAMLAAVQWRVSRVGEALSALPGDAPEATRTALLPRLARRLNCLGELARGLKRAARLKPFTCVSRAEVSAAGLNAISAHPAYASAFRLGWSALRSGIHGDLRSESLWSSPTWEIYERWCFLKVLRTLKLMFPSMHWTHAYPGAREDCIRFTGTSGDIRAVLWLQARFPAGDQRASHERRSISRERKPDIVLTLDTRDSRSMIVLDAKYSASRSSVLDAMQSAHLYQDCLRYAGNRPLAALLLIPRGNAAPWLEAVDFIRDNRVGVVALGVDEEAGALRRVLSLLIESADFPMQPVPLTPLSAPE